MARSLVVARNRLLTVRFKISSVSVSDFVDQDRTRVVYPASATVGSNILSLALENGVVIDRSNLKNLVDGDSTTGSAPKLVLALDEVPAAGATGSMMVAMTLMENDDQSGTYESSERKLTATVTVEWASDGANVVMTVPSGTASLSYEHNGNGYATLLGRMQPLMSLRSMRADGYSNTPASIEVRALDFFAAAVAFGGSIRGCA